MASSWRKRKAAEQQIASKAKGKRPMYVIRFIGEPYDGLYFSNEHSWQGVARELATQYSHRRVRQVQGHLGRAGLRLQTAIDPA